MKDDRKQGDRFVRTDDDYAKDRRARRAGDRAWATIRKGEAAKKRVLKRYPEARCVGPLTNSHNSTAMTYSIKGPLDSEGKADRLSGWHPTISQAWIEADAIMRSERLTALLAEANGKQQRSSKRSQ